MLIFWIWISGVLLRLRMLSVSQDSDNALVFLRSRIWVLKDVGFISVLQDWIAFLGLDCFLS